MDIEHQNVRGPNSGQVVHDDSNLLLLNHAADGYPTLSVKRGNRRRAPTGRDLDGFGKSRALDIVLAEDVLLGRDDTSDAGSDELDHLGVGGRAGSNENGGGVDNCIDGLEASRPHGRAGFWADVSEKGSRAKCCMQWGILLTDEINDAISDTESACSFDTATQFKDLRPERPLSTVGCGAVNLSLQLGKIFFC